jgi:hypothetical protein
MRYAVLVGLTYLSLVACKTTTSQVSDSSTKIEKKANDLLEVLRVSMKEGRQIKLVYDFDTSSASSEDGSPRVKELLEKLNNSRDLLVDDDLWLKHIDPKLSMDERLYSLAISGLSVDTKSVTLEHVLGVQLRLYAETLTSNLDHHSVAKLLQNPTQMRASIVDLVSSRPLLVNAASQLLTAEERQRAVEPVLRLFSETALSSEFELSIGYNDALKAAVKSVLVDSAPYSSDRLFLIDSDKHGLTFSCITTDWFEITTQTDSMSKTEKSKGLGIENSINLHRSDISRMDVKCGPYSYEFIAKHVDFRRRELPKSDAVDFRYPLSVTMNLSAVQSESATLSIAGQLALLSSKGYSVEKVSYSKELNKIYSDVAAKSQLIIPRFRGTDGRIESADRGVTQWISVDEDGGSEGVYLQAKKDGGGGRIDLHVFIPFNSYSANSLFDSGSLLAAFCGKVQRNDQLQTIVLGSGMDHESNFAVVYDNFYRSIKDGADALQLPLMANIHRPNPQVDSGVLRGLFDTDQNLSYLAKLQSNPSLTALKEDIAARPSLYQPSQVLRLIERTALNYKRFKANSDKDDDDKGIVEAHYALSKVSISAQCMKDQAAAVTGAKGYIELTVTNKTTGKVDRY